MVANFIKSNPAVKYIESDGRRAVYTGLAFPF